MNPLVIKCDILTKSPYCYIYCYCIYGIKICQSVNAVLLETVK